MFIKVLMPTGIISTLNVELPTVSGLRRRGYTPASIKNFCDDIGVAKMNSIIEINVLENSIREELNKTTSRVMAVLDPLKIVITNCPEENLGVFDTIVYNGIHKSTKFFFNQNFRNSSHTSSFINKGCY